jgi:hypothetical protein
MHSPDTDPARTEPLRVPTHGFAPQPAVLAGGDPDWLAAHLARDAALNEQSAVNGRWTRRLAAWGAAGVLLALLAGGGLWLYQQSQVEGALVVVAKTKPTPVPAAAVAGRGPDRAAPGMPGVAPVASSAAVPTPAAAQAPLPVMDVQKTTGVAATGGGPGGPADAPADSAQDAGSASTSTSTASVSEAAPDIAPPAPKRQRSHARKRPKAEARAADGEAAYRQRREETLMQCRAHGVNDRQCLQRGCEMTKFGFACKG